MPAESHGNKLLPDNLRRKFFRWASKISHGGANFRIFILFSAIIIITFVLFGSATEHEVLSLLAKSTVPAVVALMVVLILGSDSVLPIPSSLVVYFAFTSLNREIALACVFLGIFASSLVSYFVGLGLNIGTSPKLKTTPKQRNKPSFSVSSWLFLLLISRGVPVISEAAAIFCGYKKVVLSRFCFISSIGCTYTSFGYFIANEVGKASLSRGQQFLAMSLWTPMIFGIIYFACKMLMKKGRKHDWLL